MCAAQSTTHTHTHTLITPAPALADNLARRITVANLPERGRESQVCVCSGSDKVSFLGNLLSVCSMQRARAEGNNNMGTMHSTAGVAGQSQEKGNKIVMVTMTMTMHRLWPRRCCCTHNEAQTTLLSSQHQ